VDTNREDKESRDACDQTRLICKQCGHVHRFRYDRKTNAMLPMPEPSREEEVAQS
jgi:RNase P subunit RPR2